MLFETTQVWESYSMQELADSIENILPTNSLDIKTLFTQILNGNLKEAMGSIGDCIAYEFWGQIADMKSIVLYLLAAGLVAAVFSTMTDSFKNVEISDMGFYVAYLMQVVICLRVFAFGIELTRGVLDNIITVMQTAAPTYFLAVSFSGKALGATIFGKLAAVLIYGAQTLLLRVVVAVLETYTYMSILNGIWKEERITLLLDLVKKGMDIAMKAILMSVGAFGLAQSMVSEITDHAQVRLLQKTLSVIPGIGNAAESVSTAVITSAGIVRNSMGVTILILILMVCAVPLVKLALLTIAVKLGAALIGIIGCEKRMANMVNRIGDATGMFFKTVLTAIIIFLMVIAIVAGNN